MKMSLQNLDAFEGAVVLSGHSPAAQIEVWNQHAFLPVFDLFGVRAGQNGVAVDAAQEVVEDARKAAGGCGILVDTPLVIEAVRDLADVLLIPGEFSRQQDVLTAAAATGLPVILEKGAFLKVADFLRALENFAGGSGLVLVDAGMAFGHSDRVLDPRGLAELVAAGCRTGVHVSELVTPHGEKCRWKSEAEELVAPAVSCVATSAVLGGGFVVIDGRNPLWTPDLWSQVRCDVSVRLGKLGGGAVQNVAGVTIYDL